MEDLFDRSSWGLILARVHDVSSADVLFWAGVLLVVGCLAGAVVYATRAAWLVVGLLVLVAFAAALLLL